MSRSAPAELRPLLRSNGDVVIPRALAGRLLRALVPALADRVRGADGGRLAPGVMDTLLALQQAQEMDPSSVNGTLPDGSVSVEFMTTDEVAEALGCSMEYVRRLIRDGVLLGRRVGRQWLIDPASLAAFRGRA